MARYPNYPKAPFSASQNFLARDPAGSGQVIRVQGQSILDAAVQEILDRGDIVQAVDTLTEAKANDYESGVYVLTGGNTVTLDGGQAIYRVSDPGSGGIVMDNGNELVLLFVANTPANIITPFDSIADLPEVNAGYRVSVTGYHPSTTVGGGEFVGNASARHDGVIYFDPDRSAEIGTAAYYVDSGVNVPCWERTGVEHVTPEMAGAAGDGAIDDTDAMQAAFNNSRVVADNQYLVTTVNITTPITIEGSGRIIRDSVRSDAAFYITSDDVEIEGLTFQGSFGRATPTGSNTADNAIECQGSTTPDRLKRIKVTNCEIYGFLGFGIRMNYAEDVICSHNVINYCGYAGILYESVFNGIINENQISFIEDSLGGDAYGISLSRDPTINLTNAAKCKNCIVSNNTVSEISTWTGIDCHAAEKSIIEANVVSECANGIVLQYDSAAATFRAECNDISVLNNQVFGRTTASENEIGISSLGLAALPNINITIQGNLVRGCGDYNSTNGAIYVNETQGAVVKDNRVDRSIRHGIGIKGSSTFFVVEGNVVDGVIDGDVASNRSFVYIDLTGTSGTFRSNRFLNNTGDTNYDPVYGIWYNGSSSAVIMSKNRMRDLTGSNFLYDGTANTYSDLAWELEDNSALLSAQALTAGNTQESRNVQTRRNMYGTFGTHIIATANIYPFATNKIAAVVDGFFDIDELEILIYTVDGSIFGSAFVTGALVQISSICWED